MDKLICAVFARIFAVLCMLGVPGMILYAAYDVFISYNEDGMSLLEGWAMFAFGGAFVFFTFITWVLAIAAIMEPNKAKDKKE